ncbi:unnamed protein product [Fraxinus pennsylvanica]|uniref:Uncharacterized protein n=1 Tax=Fraxinus pennsylvanica TaxID=56036 RepID=A0AAD2A0G0_9LAMI|nr:unnamed protein product [Fraxinus pennsylvanica]
MKWDISSLYARLRLTEMEAQVLEVEEAENGLSVEKRAKCIAFRVLVDREVNKGALKNTLLQLWQLEGISLPEGAAQPQMNLPVSNPDLPQTGIDLISGETVVEDIGKDPCADIQEMDSGGDAQPSGSELMDSGQSKNWKKRARSSPGPAGHQAMEEDGYEPNSWSSKGQEVEGSEGLGSLGQIVRFSCLMVMAKFPFLVAWWCIFVSPAWLLLAVDTKLEHIITRLAEEVAQKHSAVAGDLIVRPSGDHFRFQKSRLVLVLIHIILFQNSFEIAVFFWMLVLFGFDSCIMGQVGYIVPRLVIGYSTLPPYAIVAQMGSSFNIAIFDDHIKVSAAGGGRVGGSNQVVRQDSLVAVRSVEMVGKEDAESALYQGKALEIQPATTLP